MFQDHLPLHRRQEDTTMKDNINPQKVVELLRINKTCKDIKKKFYNPIKMYKTNNDY